MNSPQQNNIIYEYPLNERMRFLLRFETLYRQYQAYSTKQSTHDTHFSLITLIEIYSLVSRIDVKKEVLKEITRQIEILGNLDNRPSLNQEKLKSIIHEHESLLHSIHDIHGQLGSHLKDNDFINSIRQRIIIPGGTCSFDLPSYHCWLAQPFDKRKKTLSEWMEPMDLIKQGVWECLWLIRASTVFKKYTAAAGFFEYVLNPDKPNQILRIQLPQHDNRHPEVSGGKHRVSIRLLQQVSPNEPGKQVSDSCEFELACCIF